MKIKYGFVTNSSSTSYIVVIPKSIDSENLLRRFSDEEEFYDEEGEEISIESLVSHIETLKSGRMIFGDDLSYEEYEICRDVVEKAGLVFTGVDCGSDRGSLIGVDEDHFNVFAEGLKRDFNEKEVCPSCGGEAAESHPCPYRTEIKGDEKYCTCCEECTTSCQEDI